MKKIINKSVHLLIILLAHLLINTSIFAQAPQKMSYQAVIRNSNDSLLISTPVGMRISLVQGTPTGIVVFSETQTATTNANGLVSLQIGMGTALSGTFANIDWAAGPYYIKTETDLSGGTNYTITSSNEILSVPYALFSANGTPGPVGPIGLTGETGAQGAIGLTGPAGVAGPTGPIGLTGPAGAAGTNGTNGAAGETGPTGAQGIQGATGLLPSGAVAGNTAYWNGSQWIVNNSNIFNNGAEVGIGTVNPNTSAKLDVESTTQGFLPPRMSTTQRNAIASPAIGLVIFNITTNCLNFYTGAAWFETCGTTTAQPQYPAGTVNCAGATTVVDVTNPTTGRIWMDRNLGATQVATSSTDVNSYGDLYQWGRRADGHQCRTSPTTATLSSIDQPAHGNFILSPNPPYEWRSPQNANLWQGVNGVNNPCPSGYRIPTETEINAERLSWSQNNSAGAFASPLKWTLAGNRYNYDGSLVNVGLGGRYWSSTLSSTVWGVYSRDLNFDSSDANMLHQPRGDGLTVRCLKDASAIPATLGAINCGSTSITGTLTSGTAASGVSASVPYTGGNAGTYVAQNVSSTGVVGLTATLAAGSLANGAGSLTYTITGTPTTSGSASFAITLGGQSCAFTVSVSDTSSTYPAGTVHCTAGATAVVDVTNPTTGKIWMDRNLGATQVATSSTDVNSYGDLYQWGRRADGHQCRTSATTSTLSSIDQPAHGDFILAPYASLDWRSPQNANLWQGVNGVNNPCPSGYRIPTETELEAERLSWSQNNSVGAFASPLKLPVPGRRNFSDGLFSVVGSDGFYWSSSVIDTYTLSLNGFGTFSANIWEDVRANGHAVRCLKD